MAPKVFIVVLNWNGWRDTIECVESLKKIDYPNYKVVIVDNGSTDGSEGILRKRFPHCKFIQTGTNLGFAGGNNAGMKFALRNGADYILTLNNDTVVHHKFLSELVKVAESEPNIGVVQSKILRKSNHKIIDSLGQALFSFRGPKDIQYGKRDNGKFDTIHEIFGACAAAAIFKNKVISKVGLFDEDFFCIFEDVDFSWRIRLAGYKILLSPKSIVYHKRGMSGISVPEYRYYRNRNQLYLVIKYYPSNLILKFLVFHLYRLIVVLWYLLEMENGIRILTMGINKKLKTRKFIQDNPAISDLQKEWL